MSKQVIFMLVAPPCETWSQARYLTQGLDPGRCPRPLRSAQKPWGVKGLSSKEYEQLHIASVLLMTTIRLLVACVASGVSAVAEHPAMPADYMKPSIWRLAYIKWLAAVSAAELLVFCQSTHGQVSKKPTCFFSLRNPTLRKYLYRYQGHECTRPDAQNLRVLGGKLESGQWATSETKEYPPSLCRALALSVLDNINSGHQERGDPMTDDSVPGTVVLGGVDQDKYEKYYQKYVVRHDPYDEHDQQDIKADCMLHNTNSR